jgi:hypothetical protein
MRVIQKIKIVCLWRKISKISIKFTVSLLQTLCYFFLHSCHEHSGTFHSMWQVFVCFHHRPLPPVFNHCLMASFTSLLLKSLPPKNSFNVGNKWKSLDPGLATCSMLECQPVRVLCANTLYSLDDLLNIKIYLGSLKLHIKLRNLKPFAPQLNAQSDVQETNLNESCIMKTIKWLPSQPCIWCSGNHTAWCIYHMLDARGLIGSLPVLLDLFVWEVITFILILHDKLRPPK